MKNSTALLGGFSLAVLSFWAATAAPGSRSVWGGAYTEAQAARGAAIYEAHCATCHGTALDGGAGPPLAGKTFVYSWSGLSVNDLFERIHNTMPADSPGSLTPQEAADLVAYILSTNHFPAGDAELPTEVDSLKTIQITGKNRAEQRATSKTHE